jgi:multiple sugar transport system permease protein
LSIDGVGLTGDAGERARLRVRSHRAALWRRGLGSSGLTLGAALLAVLMVFPFFWMVTSSLKPQQELFRMPPTLLPSQWLFGNYGEAWEAARFSRYFGNSIFVTLSGTLLTLAVSAMAAYALAKLEFRSRELIFWLIIASQMIPGIVTLIPSFLIVKNMPLAGGNNLFGSGGHGWLNSYEALIVPGIAAAFGVFLLRQFFQSVPNELLFAARVDGCDEFRIFRSIVLPLAKPALATLAIFTFQGYWNDFVWPLVVTTDDTVRTVQLGLTVFRQRFTTEWGPLMAGVTIATLPMVLVFLSAQRYFVSGIALTGIKE